MTLGAVARIPVSPNNRTAASDPRPIVTVDMSEVVKSSGGNNDPLRHEGGKPGRSSSDESCTQPTTISDLDEYYELQSQSFRGVSFRDYYGEGSSSATTNSSNADPQQEEQHEEEDTHVPPEVVQATAAGAAEETASDARLRDHPTLRPHGPTPPVIRPYDLDAVPVSTRRNAWLTLKTPAATRVQRQRLSRSSASAASASTCQDDDCHTDRRDTAEARESGEGGRPRRRGIRFCAVHVRDYAQTVGDNPSVSYGPPISLDWEYTARDAVTVDAYETARGRRRNLRQMMMNHYHRVNVLTHACGFSEDVLRAAQKAAERIRTQRAVTRALLGVCKFEEAWQSTKRKLKGKKKDDEAAAR